MVRALIPFVRILLFSASVMRWTWLDWSEKWITLSPIFWAFWMERFKSFKASLFFIRRFSLKLMCWGVRFWTLSLFKWETPREWILLRPAPGRLPPLSPLHKLSSCCSFIRCFIQSGPKGCQLTLMNLAYIIQASHPPWIQISNATKVKLIMNRIVKFERNKCLDLVVSI